MMMLFNSALDLPVTTSLVRDQLWSLSLMFACHVVTLMVPYIAVLDKNVV